MPCILYNALWFSKLLGIYFFLGAISKVGKLEFITLILEICLMKRESEFLKAVMGANSEPLTHVAFSFSVLILQGNHSYQVLPRLYRVVEGLNKCLALFYFFHLVKKVNYNLILTAVFLSTSDSF